MKNFFLIPICLAIFLAVAHSSGYSDGAFEQLDDDGKDVVLNMIRNHRKSVTDPVENNWQNDSRLPRNVLECISEHSEDSELSRLPNYIYNVLSFIKFNIGDYTMFGLVNKDFKFMVKFNFEKDGTFFTNLIEKIKKNPNLNKLSILKDHDWSIRRNDPSAQFIYAKMCYHGLETGINHVIALKYFKKAAKNGFKLANDYIKKIKKINKNNEFIYVDISELTKPMEQKKDLRAIIGNSTLCFFNRAEAIEKLPTLKSRDEAYIFLAEEYRENPLERCVLDSISKDNPYRGRALLALLKRSTDEWEIKNILKSLYKQEDIDEGARFFSLNRNFSISDRLKASLKLSDKKEADKIINKMATEKGHSLTTFIEIISTLSESDERRDQILLAIANDEQDYSKLTSEEFKTDPDFFYTTIIEENSKLNNDLSNVDSDCDSESESDFDFDFGPDYGYNPDFNPDPDFNTDSESESDLEDQDGFTMLTENTIFNADVRYRINALVAIKSNKREAQKQLLKYLKKKEIFFDDFKKVVDALDSENEERNKAILKRLNSRKKNISETGELLLCLPKKMIINTFLEQIKSLKDEKNIMTMTMANCFSEALKKNKIEDTTKIDEVYLSIVKTTGFNNLNRLNAAKKIKDLLKRIEALEYIIKTETMKGEYLRSTKIKAVKALPNGYEKDGKDKKQIIKALKEKYESDGDWFDRHLIKE